MTTRIVTQLGNQRRIRARNVSGRIIPAFGCIVLAYDLEFDNEGVLYHVTNIDDAELQGTYRVIHNGGSSVNMGESISCDGVGFNLEQPILEGEIGEVTFDTPALCLADEQSYFSIPEAIILSNNSFGLIPVTSFDPTFPTAYLSAFRVMGPVGIGLSSTVTDGVTSNVPYQYAYVAIRARINQFYGEEDVSLGFGIFV